MAKILLQIGLCCFNYARTCCSDLARPCKAMNLSDKTELL